jgi:hypothetical protein
MLPNARRGFVVATQRQKNDRRDDVSVFEEKLADAD